VKPEPHPDPSANNPAMVARPGSAPPRPARGPSTPCPCCARGAAKDRGQGRDRAPLCDTRLMDDLWPARRSRASSRPWWASMAPRTMTPSLTGWRFRSPCASRLPPWAGRRGASGLHLGHDRRAQGHDALPPRPPRHRGRLREGSPERHARGRLRGEPAPCLHLRARGPCRLPVAFRGRCPRLLEQATPPNMVEIIEQLRATVCFTAPTAYRVMLRAMAEGADLSSLRAAVSAGRDPARPRLRGMDRPHRQAPPRRDRRDRDAPHLHHQPLRGPLRGLHRPPRHGLRGSHRRRGHGGSCRRARSGASPSAGPPAAAIFRTAASGTTSGTAGTSPATASGRTRGGASISRPGRTT
jgi:hypothetical protein